MLKISLLFVFVLLFTTYLGQSQSPSVEVADEMVFAPDDCGQLAQSMPIDPLITQAIGTWPLWLSVSVAAADGKGVLYVPNRHNLTHPDLEGWCRLVRAALV